MSGFDVSADLEEGISYLCPIGYTKSSRCGYCAGRGNKSFSYYASAKTLTPEFYKTLLDRYWRRSGTLLYRPDQNRACCPHYTLRLDSSLFKPSKDQRQAVNRFNKHVTGDAYAKEAARLFPLSRAEARKRDNEFDLPARIHEAEAESLRPSLRPAHQFTVTLEDDTFSEEKYVVYENYQSIIHHEKASRPQFIRFLCDSPIQRGTAARPDGSRQRFGSFHQCYRLDGRLVAMGVLDLLPECVSAVYFIYHESIHSLSPGKLGALREIALAIEDGYRYWYPGFYIHTCPKMRYKMDYSPQYILDPETLEWDLCDSDVLGLLTANHYLSLSRHRRALLDHREHAKPDPGDPGQQLPDRPPDGPSTEARIGKGGGVVAEETGPGGVGGAARTIRAGEEAEQAEEEGAVAAEEGEDGDAERNQDNKNRWLFGSRMPGITPLSEMLKIDLGGLGIQLEGPSFRSECLTMKDLMAWEEQSVADNSTFKSGVAELIAAIGPDQMSQIRLFSRVSDAG